MIADKNSRGMVRGDRGLDGEPGAGCRGPRVEICSGNVSVLSNFSRHWHTVRHLKPRQIFYQVSRRLRKPPFLTKTETPTDWRPLPLRRWPVKRTSWTEGGRFTFLNRGADLGQPIDWQAKHLPKLWQYNLHYFEFLLQAGIEPAVGLRLMEDWSARHTPRLDNVGWEPYPTSLRLVSWIKFLGGEQTPPDSVVSSLALQAANLERQLEYHLGGNHLFVNGKALWFAGAVLQDASWVALGRRIVLQELEEQFLPDGGHFELSPMYHALATEDLIDLANLCRGVGDDHSFSKLKPFAQRALGWLDGITGKTGRIPLLNDSAHGIAPTTGQLVEYAQGLGIRPETTAQHAKFDSGWVGRNLSGYWVLERDPLQVLFDTAPIGPDHLPGHAHCDMLAVLLNCAGDEILTDTGVYEYDETARRTYSRSTVAHNTVSVDDLEQADIWKSFRIGRRSRPCDVQIEAGEISAAVTFRNGIRHRRRLCLREDGIEIMDSLTGRGTHLYRAHFHFAPGLAVRQETPTLFRVGTLLRLEIFGAKGRVIETEQFPEFGVARVRKTLQLEGSFYNAGKFSVRCTYSS